MQQMLWSLAVVLGIHLVGCADGVDPGERVGREREAVGTGPTAHMTWKVEEKFTEFEDAADGAKLMDLNPSRADIRNPKLRVTLDACDSTASNGETWPLSLLLYAFIVTPKNGGDPLYLFEFPLCSTTVELKPGAYTVELFVTDTQTGAFDGLSRDIEPKNILIVSLGDSVASGEGNPDVPGSVQFITDQNGIPLDTNWVVPRWHNLVCHRSRWSGHAQAARVIERADKNSAVTFVSLACSGAAIDSGLLAPGISVDEETATPDQMAELERLLCDNNGTNCVPVDALLLSIGANDLGFGPVVERCAWPGSKCLHTGTEMYEAVQRELGELPNKFQDVANALNAFTIGEVYLVEYMDPSRNGSGDICREMVFRDAVGDAAFEDEFVEAAIEVALGDPFPLPVLDIPFAPNLIDDQIKDADAKIYRTEIRGLNDVFYLPLLQELKDAANLHGWTYVGGVKDAFENHGYCANNSFIVNYSESKALQWNDAGTMHPDRSGHIATAKEILDVLGPDLGFNGAASMSLPEWAAEKEGSNPVRLVTGPYSASLEDPALWGGSGLSAAVDTDIYTEGDGSLRWDASGYQEIVSATFDTGELFRVGDRLVVDVNVRELPSAAVDWAAMQAYVTISDKNINRQYLGQVQLKNACRPPLTGACADSEGWSQLEISVPSQLKQALLESSGKTKLHLALNTATSAPTRLNVDHLRFETNRVRHPTRNPWRVPGAGPIPGPCPYSSCSNSTSLARYQNSGSFGSTTQPKQFVVTDTLTGWQASEMQGRQISVNGVVVQPGQMPLPPRTIDGKYYFRFSEGGPTWSSWSFW